MSDLRLEDLVVPNPNIEGDYYPVSRAEVLGAALIEDCPDCDKCERCNGYGNVEGPGYTSTGCDVCAAGRIPREGDDVCETCGDRGRKFIDGVRVRTELDDSARGYRETLVVPLSMLEGEDT